MSVTPLKAFLRERGLTVSWLGKEIGLDRSNASLLVNGWATTSTTRRWAPRIAAALGVQIPQIFPDLAPEQPEHKEDNDAA